MHLESPKLLQITKLGSEFQIFESMNHAAGDAPYVSLNTVATHLEYLGNLEKSGNLRVLREKSGKIGKVRESVFLHMVNYRKY